MERALANEDEEFAATRWSDALSSAGTASGGYGGLRVGARLVDSRVVRVAATAAQAFTPVRRIGGESGWYYANFLWRLRGFVDLLVGGVGVRRGRRHPETLAPSMEACGLFVSDVCRSNALPYYYGDRKIAFTCCVLF